jgi:hypothetical protein
LVLHHVIQNVHVWMKRMHFTNGKLNPRFGIVAWNSAPQPSNGMGTGALRRP